MQPTKLSVSYNKIIGKKKGECYILEVVFWFCFLLGIVVTILSFLISSLIEGIFDAIFPFDLTFFSSVTVFGGLTIFGGTGILLSEHSSFSVLAVLIFSVLVAAVSFILIYLLVGRPAQQADQSVGFGLNDLKGKTGTITITVPAKGAGEVMITTSGGNTNQIAQSFTGEEIPQGSIVTVTEVNEHILFVRRIDPNDEE